jgi:hypothetical protein
VTPEATGWLTSFWNASILMKSIFEFVVLKYLTRLFSTVAQLMDNVGEFWRRHSIPYDLTETCLQQLHLQEDVAPIRSGEMDPRENCVQDTSAHASRLGEVL